MDALNDIYTATNGEAWVCTRSSGTPWVFTSTANPCDDNWIGIGCTSDNHVQLLLLAYCNLDGTLPASIGQLRNLTHLSLSTNRLRGVIPDVFDEMPGLTEIYLSKNQLSGPMPPSLSQMVNVSTLNLQDNRLSGRLETAFDPSKQKKLKNVNLNDNDFTGPLPDVLFQNPSIELIHIGHNCLTGTLPNSVCEATGAYELDFSCLACGSSCTSRLAEQSNFIVHHPVHGTVPACIFTELKLFTLVLQDNYFTGSLPSVAVVWPTSFYASHNALSGTVPAALLTGGTSATNVNADLSNNKFSGDIDNSVVLPPQSSLTLSYNRLSGPAFGGDWPQGYELDVLTGNILGCNGEEHRLPQGDSAYGRYSCGSDDFNKPIIAWVAAASGLAALCGVVWCWRGRLDAHLHITAAVEQVQQWRAVLQGKHVDVELLSLVRIRDMVLLLNKVAVAVVAGAVCILAPTYAGLSASYGTYSHQYAWVISAVLLSGRVPFAVCFTVFALVLGTAIAALFAGHARISVPEQSARPLSNHETSQPRIIVASAVYLIVNFAVVGAVNVAFVATSVYTSAIYQLGISVFKVGWNLFVAPYFSRWLAYELSAARADWFTLELFVSIMNNIGIPLLAVFFVSPQCLYYLMCGGLASYGAGFGTIPNYDSPFYYSYQCSYVYMDYYAAAFVYACMMAGFATPLVELSAVLLYQWAPSGSFLRACLQRILPRSIRPVETDADGIPDRSVLRPFFDTTRFLVTQLTSLALVLTMGVVFPPLAVPVAVTMLLSAAFVMLKVGRLLSDAADAGQRKYVDIIEQECENVATPTIMRRAFWLLLWFGCWFYTLFLFDMLGDAVGFFAAYWVIIVVPLLPLIIVAGSYAAAQYSSRGHKRDDLSIIELSAGQDTVRAPFNHA
jgi:hypothetical protein